MITLFIICAAQLAAIILPLWALLRLLDQRDNPDDYEF